MQQLVLDLVDELDGKWNDIMIHPHGTFVFRTLLNLLSGQSISSDTEIRSKKSATFNANHNLAKVWVWTLVSSMEYFIFTDLTEQNKCSYFFLGS
jgi:hypothetical protein